MNFRDFGKAIDVAPGTLSRLAHGSVVDYETILKIMKHYDMELAEEVEALLNYVRKALLRRAKAIRSTASKEQGEEK